MTDQRRMNSCHKRVNASRLIALCVVALISVSGCKEKVAEELHFREPVPPAGHKVKIVSDKALNAKEGSTVLLFSAIPADMDRDEIKELMVHFYRQVNQRKGFRGGGLADTVDLRFYGSEAKAKAGGDDWLAQVLRRGQGTDAEFTNRQTPPLKKWAIKHLGKQPQFSGKLQLDLKADAKEMAIELTVPFVTDDGSGAYVKKLTYTKATTGFAQYTRSLFDKIEGLRKLTFIGKHNDKVVMKISLNREQYTALALSQVEEGMGAFQGKFMNDLLARKMKESTLQKKLAKERRRVYRLTFAKLPPEQIELAKFLK
jgi:hypothetical protein